MLVSFLQDRVNNQMTVLFNLITSQDARTGIEVARDSRTLATAIKLDSSSMKSLAVVSVMFLLGTFVASFFSMPLLQVRNNTLDFSSKIWLYWATTIPLTVITMLSWYMWICRKRMLIRRASRQPRATVRTEFAVAYTKASVCNHWPISA
jgi:Mg2+ and Co2+ transporter CorA